MRIDPRNARSFEIFAVLLKSGENRLAYTQDPAQIGPLLARKDRSYFAAELPSDWVLLADSFLPFIKGPAAAFKNPPASSYPMLLNLRTLETMRLGPFTPRGA